MVVMTEHNHKTGLLVPDKHDHHSLQFVVMYTPSASAEYEQVGEVKVISCFRNRISPSFPDLWVKIVLIHGHCPLSLHTMM